MSALIQAVSPWVAVGAGLVPILAGLWQLTSGPRLRRRLDLLRGEREVAAGDPYVRGVLDALAREDLARLVAQRRLRPGSGAFLLLCALYMIVPWVLIGRELQRQLESSDRALGRVLGQVLFGPGHDPPAFFILSFQITCIVCWIWWLGARADVRDAFLRGESLRPGINPFSSKRRVRGMVRVCVGVIGLDAIAVAIAAATATTTGQPGWQPFTFMAGGFAAYLGLIGASRVARSLSPVDRVVPDVERASRPEVEMTSAPGAEVRPSRWSLAVGAGVLLLRAVSARRVPRGPAHLGRR